VAVIGVVGLGYVGITTAVGMARLGHEVIGYDVDTERADMLAAGQAPIYEPGLEEELTDLLKLGNLNFTGSLNELALREPEYFFVCVPTPQDASGAANLSFVLGSAGDLSRIAPPGSVVVLKSTVPVGSGERVTKTLAREDVFVASNPEFLREGRALFDFMNPDRIVAGAANPEVANRVLGLYSEIKSEKISTSIESAELVKYSTNAYLAMRLSFVNDLAALCERVGADIDDVVMGLGSDSRIGPSFLAPGPGWGGSCFPKDTRALVSVASDYGLDLPLIDAALESNEASMSRVVETLKSLCGGGLEGKVVAVWGLAFKAGTDDVRDSPAVNIVKRLIDRGATVQAYDPVAIGPNLSGLTQCSTALQAVSGADALAVLTEWPEFSNVPPQEVAQLMTSSSVFDTRRILPIAWRDHVTTLRILGGATK
jgi:UDPglucose 6-dehydrogenase